MRCYDVTSWSYVNLDDPIVKTSGGSTRRSYVAWGPTYQVLYPAVTVGRVAPLASVADITTSWCHSSGLCWVVLLDGHTWQMVKCSYWSRIPFVMAGRVAPLVPTADSAAPNCPFLYLACRTTLCFVLNLYVGHTLVGPCNE